MAYQEMHPLSIEVDMAGRLLQASLAMHAKTVAPGTIVVRYGEGELVDPHFTSQERVPLFVVLDDTGHPTNGDYYPGETVPFRCGLPGDVFNGEVYTDNGYGVDAAPGIPVHLSTEGSFVPTNDRTTYVVATILEILGYLEGRPFHDMYWCMLEVC